MKSLETLIKLHDKELNDLRIELKRCEDNKNELTNYSQKMKEELEAELELVSKDPSLGQTFSSYRKVIDERQNNIEEALIDLDRKISSLNEDIGLLYIEIKKYDLLLQRKKLQEKKKLEKEEEKFIDEMVSMRHNLED
ncbi:flagellar FliJ family protein [Rickettsiales bacterium]|nr:flagellar FliJ family protein [Rickettsiales bacterium]